jgi:hypothetical protein
MHRRRRPSALVLIALGVAVAVAAAVGAGTRTVANSDAVSPLDDNATLVSAASSPPS